MRWLVIDLVLMLLALGVLAVIATSLWRRAHALSRELGAVRGRIQQATDGLEETLDAAPGRGKRNS